MKIALVSMLLAVAASGANAAPRNADPDWPCQQVKVSELSEGSFWTGPPTGVAGGGWRQDGQVTALVGLVVQRRLPIDDARQRIADFAKSAGAEKNRALLALFAGVFEVLNGERANVLNGLDRFGQRQKALAASLRQDGEMLRAAQTSEPADDAKVSELTQRLLWDQQVFEGRRQSLRFACDVPTIIEQRLYALSKAIQQSLE